MILVTWISCDWNQLGAVFLKFPIYHHLTDSSPPDQLLSLHFLQGAEEEGEGVWKPPANIRQMSLVEDPKLYMSRVPGTAGPLLLVAMLPSQFL